MSQLLLFHTGFDVISAPDVHYGRKNADFGQGFYLSDDEQFALRWAKLRKDRDTYINRYVLETEGLKILRLDRDKTWFDYIYRNRGGYQDLLAETDVIIGPIANDTIYNTLGILTSGFVSRDLSLKVLLQGPLYTQIVLKTEKAASALTFLGADLLEREKILALRAKVQEEEAAYQVLLGRIIGDASDDDTLA